MMYESAKKRASVSIFLTIGVLVFAAAILANRLGLDPNSGWGKGRIALLALGLLIAALPWITTRQIRTSDKLAYSDLFVFPVLVIVIGIYFWFATVSHDFTSNYYSLLATSFRHGDLFLPLKPDPALLQLPNPYDPATRQGVKYPIDLSLYQGKFYLYWGPAPSALLALMQPFLPWKIEEVHLLFIFMCGIFLAEYGFIMYLWERFFPNIPKWMLILSILLAGLANPALWLLSQPKIYEAAIAGAQFFFISGFVLVLLAVDANAPSAWKLALAGVLWALAVLTRTVQVFPVIFMTLMLMYRFFKIYRHSFTQFVTALIPLGIPLVLGAVGFCGYNQARFGSFLETGFTYQLAAHYLQKYMSDLFSPVYILQNLYNYLLNPFVVKQGFPFFYPLRGAVKGVISWQALPELYTAQAITGFLYTVPFLVFAVLPVIFVLRQLFQKRHINASLRDSESTLFQWITISLLGSFVLPFLSLLTFFWAAMRYVEDFMPSLILLSILGFWQGYQLTSKNLKQGTIYATFGAVLAGFSLIASIFLALAVCFANGLL